MELRRTFTPGVAFQAALVLFLLGVGVHSLWPLSIVVSWIWPIAFVCVSCGFICVRDRYVMRWVVICVAAFLFGVWRFDVSLPTPSDGMEPSIGLRVTAYGRVVSTKSATLGTIEILDVRRVDMDLVRGPGALLTFRTFTHTIPVVGSEVAVTCVIRQIRIDDTQSYIWQSQAKRGVWTECGGSTTVDVLAKPSSMDIFAALDAWRRILTARIGEVYSHDDATLLSGILYGDQDLSPEQSDVMRRAGLMHLVAVSGSNVTIVVNVLLGVLLAVGIHRRRAFWFLCVGIVTFLGFVGFSASVVRAGIMSFFILLARRVGRAPSPARLLLITAAVVTLTNPWLLVFDVGFALSFLATWGLLAWTPVIAERCRWLPERCGLREAFATTAGATIMTIPYLAWSFGQMSLAGLLTNLLALPLVPWIMMWGAIAAAWGRSPGFVYVSLPAYGMLHLLDRIAHLADAFPFLNIHVQSFGVLLLFAWYAVLFCLWKQWKMKK